MSRLSSWLSLFASSGTLICCALPSLLVALGMGATMAGLVTTFPQLVFLSRYKAIVFTFSGIMMVFAFSMHWRSRNEPCPIDPELAKVCMSSRKYSKIILIFSGTLWFIGAFFAFIAPLLN